MITFEGENQNNLRPDDWERVQRLGVLKGVDTPSAYCEKVTIGLKNAYSLISACENPVPSISLIQKLHYHTFEKVHPWAGEFRPKGHEVMIGNMACVDAKDIRKELSALTKEMKAEPFFGTHQYISEVIAFYHSSFEAIHPFLDGNGRVGRIIMHRQMQLGLGLKQEANISKTKYLEVLRHAQQTGELEPFGKVLLKAVKAPQISKGLGLT